MDRQTYNAKLTELRETRTKVTDADKAVASAAQALAKAERDRDALTAKRARQVAELAGYEKADGATIAKAAGMPLVEVVRIAPLLDPTPASARTAGQTAPTIDAPADTEPVSPAAEQQPAAPAAAAVVTPDIPMDQPPARPATEPAVHVPAPAQDGEPRELPSIPAGYAGRPFTALTSKLVSVRPNFVQQVRRTAYLDADTGHLIAGPHSLRLELGAGTPEEIVTAVQSAVGGGAERIYITAGAPWHRDSKRYPTLKEAVAAWLNTPSRILTTATGRGRDQQAGHFVHERQPVGRYAHVSAPDGPMVEIRSVGEWFDPSGADPATVRAAFDLLEEALRHEDRFPDAVLMGSPSQTGRDLWTRTIPTTGKWAGGFPVMSEELRGLLHATGGQGRTELLLPPRVPAELPGLYEVDRTFAYGRHLWHSGVGAPERLTGAGFATLDKTHQTKALLSCSHWQVRVTVPKDWRHIGLLPAPIGGDRAWAYTAEPGATFVTWAGGSEIYGALNNPLAKADPSLRWGIEVLDGLVWEEGKPLDEWGKKLIATWDYLTNLSRIHGDEQTRQAAYLASRGVRSILLYGIGQFAQRPTMTTGTTPIGQRVPDGVEILGQDDQVTTWQRVAGFSRNPNAHPEWALGVWSGARAALLDMPMKEDKVRVGALHLPSGSIVALRTDAIYTTVKPDWPYHGRPGDYLLKGALDGPVPAPTTLDELLARREEGRAALTALDTAGAR